MKIAIYSDPVMGRGGGSKVVIELANVLKADIITPGIDSRLLKKVGKGSKVINIGNASINKIYSLGFLFEAPIRFIFCRKFNYDVNIFFGTSSIFASRKGEKNIWFCFTPNRIMYDLKEWKLRNDSFWKKTVYLVHIILFQRRDQTVVKNNFVKIIAQTKHVQERIKKYYKKDSEVIYSPIDTSQYEFNKFGDFFLTVSRLSPEKRMDLIATAFTEMKDKKLVMVGKGIEMEKIKRIISNHNNITLLDSVEDDELRKLYADCLATIYMPINEDFGLVPLEGMASGKACIAADEGGCRETVVHGRTGFLIEAKEEAIVEIVSRFSVAQAKAMRDDCIAQAKKFDIEQSEKKWKNIVKNINYGKSN